MNYYEECPKCWSKDINYVEYLGAFDWALTMECKACNTSIHRSSGKEILKLEQKYKYGPVMFYLEGGDVYINNRQIWKES